MAFSARVAAVGCTYRFADAVTRGELSYTTPAMEREQHACSSLLTRAGAVLADPAPIPTRPVRGCIAMAFTARAWPLLDAPTALLMPSRAASSAT